MKFLSIAIGGATGALLRYCVTLLVPRAGSSGFPWATIIVNLVGSFLIGIFGYLAEKAVLAPHMHGFVLVGVLGAFTTFSTFMFENLQLIQSRSIWLFALYLGISSVAGLFLVLAGYQLGRQFI